MSTTRSAELQFCLPYRVRKGKKYYVATLPDFEISSQGESQAKAVENLVEAASLFFVSCLERGTLEIVLRESGFHPALAAGRTKDASKQKADWLSVPIPLIASQARDATPNA